MEPKYWGQPQRMVRDDGTSDGVGCVVVGGVIVVVIGIGIAIIGCCCGYL